MMKLQSDESAIMTLKGEIKTKEEQRRFYKATDYVLNLEVKTIKDNKYVSENFSIQMITRNAQEFNATMGKIEKFLELDKYSNNNKEHFINLKDFMKVYYPAIVMYETKQLPEDKRKANCFKMEFEQKVLLGEFVYLDSKDQPLGLYELRIYDPKLDNQGRPIIQFTFPRTYVETLKKKFYEHGLHKLFMSILQEILMIYEEEFEKILKPKLQNENLVSSEHQ